MYVNRLVYGTQLPYEQQENPPYLTFTHMIDATPQHNQTTPDFPNFHMTDFETIALIVPLINGFLIFLTYFPQCVLFVYVCVNNY